MRRFRVLAMWLRSLFRTRRADAELDAEIQFHLAQQIEENLARGMNRKEARYAALRVIGGITQIKEECRDMRRINWIENLASDLGYSIRVLRQSPGFLTVAVLTLALGVGANTAIFSVINAVLLSPLPYRDPDRLVMVREVIPLIGPAPIDVSGPDISQIRKLNHVFEAVGGIGLWTYELSGITEPQRVVANRTSSDLFKVLGVQPLLGRGFTAEEEPAGHHVVILSYRLWQSRFGGDRKILGRTVDLDRLPYTIVGVMPQTFVFPLPGMATGPAAAIWVPLALTKDELRDIGDNFDFTVFAKLKTGIAVQQADADLQMVAKGILRTYDEWARVNHQSLGALQLGVVAQPLNQRVRGPVKTMLWMLFGAVGFVLLISCVNVANLVLARAAGRQREIALRLALGAGKLRLLRQLLVEGMVLAFAGGVLGAFAAIWIKQALVAMIPPNVPRFRDINLDGHVLGFSFLITALCGLVFGLLPAFSASRTDLNHTLKEGARSASQGRAQQRMRAAFVVVEVALSVMLLIGAGLLMRSFARVLSTSPGFRPQHVLTTEIDLPAAQYRGKFASFFKQLMDRLQQSPGVIAAGGSTDLPLEGAWTRLFTLEGREPPSGAGSNMCFHSVIYGNYLPTMGIPLLRGRYFNEHDQHDSTSVLIVSESFAKKSWPGEDPLGKRLKWGTPQSDSKWLTVVGVVGDVKQGPLDAATVPHTYQPYAQLDALNALHLVVRGEGEAENLSATVRRAVWSLDRQLALAPMETMDQVINGSTSARRFNLFLLASFAALALLLAAIGIYGVLAYAVARRTHEIGVRMALGARAGDVVRLVLGQSLRLTAIGAACGVAGALSLTRFLENLLFEVRGTDPATFVGVLFALGGAALAASYFPTRRATRIEPSAALRHE